MITVAGLRFLKVHQADNHAKDINLHHEQTLDVGLFLLFV